MTKLFFFSCLMCIGSVICSYAQTAQTMSDAQKTEILNVHNTARDEVGVTHLVWDEALATTASEWADYLVSHHTFQHSTTAQRGESGENLWQGSAGHFSLTEMIGFWASEKQYYTHTAISKKKQKRETGHYTQMVWSQTQKVGCALKTSEDNKLEVLVCHYSPVGNVVGSLPY